ncbi:MAG TPA: Glu/Leu/Phe/Val dehydrogenase [Rhabdochlamydiaceae bacterium]|nr:Glu/Leu/Phe/Val dehydrogenase [Rhabdochlamydiaceae bacterium]
MTLIVEETLVLEEIFIPGYERVVKVTDEKAGLKAIISLHNTSIGPALGGTRIYPYPSFDDALNDVLRLSKGMTYKSALAETGLGGGKSVIILDPKKGKTEESLMAFGKAVHQLEGAYICAEDVGCTTSDMMVIRRTTPYVVGLPHEKSSGDPSPFTAWGTFRGIQSVQKKLYGNDSLKDKVVAVQGLGSVGSRVAEFLFWAGAKLILCDTNLDKAHQIAGKFGAEVCEPEDILTVECDIFAPCALGGILNQNTIPKLKCRAIAGCANNQLLKDSDADELMKRGILYAPDFVVNAGGLINVNEELDPEGYRPDVSRNKTDAIYDRLMIIYDIAEQNRFSTNAAAVSLGDYRLKYGIGKRVHSIHLHHADSNF